MRCRLGFMEHVGGDVQQGVGYDDAAFGAAERRGDADQRDWELRFLSALARKVTTRTPGSRPWEVHTLALGVDQLTVVVRAWSHDPPYNSRLLGLHEHLPTIRRSLGKDDDAEAAAGVWYDEIFTPLSWPQGHPDADGIYWKN